MDSTEDTASKMSSIVACCRGNVFAEPLPNNVRKQANKTQGEVKITAGNTVYPSRGQNSLYVIELLLHTDSA
jgi:hypothetical protein